MKIVKVGRVGGKIQQVCLDDRQDVNGALSAAGMSKRSNEDIWLNHQVVAGTAFVKDGETIILEPVSISPAIRAFIDKLIEHEVIDEQDYTDDYGNIVYSEVMEYERNMINDLARSAKEV